MGNWRDLIIEKLENYTGYDADFGDAHIVVKCQNQESFAVSIRETDEEFLVAFDGWHEHFDDEEDALNCFAFGLSQECRLEITKRGKMECAWTVQALQDGAWVDDSTTGLVLIPFWRPRQIEYRHNLIRKEES